MTEPTSALSFEDLIVEVAQKMGVAYYGAAGDEVAQVPQNDYDLSEVKRHINNGLRMFIADAPANGWRWTRPVASLTYWGSIAVDDDVTATAAYSAVTGLTTITASEDTFYPSMEGKTLTVTDVADITISGYVSATVVTASGDVSWVGSKTFEMTSDGTFTLPLTFGGQYEGPITFAAGSNRAVALEWMDEAFLRRLRENTNTETGDPRYAAVRLVPGSRRRWQMMLYPTPTDSRVVEFSYELYFDKLVELTDLHPAGFVMDDAVKAACFAAMERDVDDNATGALNQYYRSVALPNAYRADARSAPQRLGYCGNPGRGLRNLRNFRDFVSRPTVTFTE